MSALKAVKAHLIDVKKHLNDWEKGDPCLGNWTGVICYNASGADGYFHIKELYVNLYKHFFLISSASFLNCICFGYCKFGWFSTN